MVHILEFWCEIGELPSIASEVPAYKIEFNVGFDYKPGGKPMGGPEKIDDLPPGEYRLVDKPLKQYGWSMLLIQDC